MKSLLSVTLGLVVLCLAACGGSNGHTGTSGALARATGSHQPRSGRLLNDGDGDAAAGTPHTGTGADSDEDSYSGEGYYDFDDENVLDYGHLATPAETDTTTAVIRSYYAAAARGDGARVCELLLAGIARAVPAEYAQTPGFKTPRGSGCAPVMSAVLKALQRQWSAENAALKTGIVRIEGATADVLLSFGAVWPNRYIAVKREHGEWKVANMSALDLP